MNKTTLYLVQVFILTSLLYSCHSKNTDKKASNNPSKVISFIEGVVVKPGIVDQTISISGTLKPFEETVLMSDISGRIVKINLPEGSFVKQGTLLVKLFDDDLQAQLQDYWPN